MAQIVAIVQASVNVHLVIAITALAVIAMSINVATELQMIAHLGIVHLVTARLTAVRLVSVHLAIVQLTPTLAADLTTMVSNHAKTHHVMAIATEMASTVALQKAAIQKVAVANNALSNVVRALDQKALVQLNVTMVTAHRAALVNSRNRLDIIS